MKRIILVFFSLFLFAKANAQNMLTGRVTDAQTGEALPGVNIVVPETMTGTYTGENGRYRLSHLPDGNFLIKFSFVGYETVIKKVHFAGRKETLDVSLSPLVIKGQEVVVTGTFTETQHENTLKIDALDAKSIAANAAPSFTESLATVPGVSVISKGPGVATPVIRGLSTSNILVLNNGVPLENFQFSEDHPYMIDASGVGRVEIIKGPASLMYGSGAMGGVVNILPEPLAPSGSVEGDVTLKFFSNTAGLAPGFGIKGNRNGFVWGVRGAMNSNRDFRQGNGEFAPNSRFNRYSAKAYTGIISKRGSFRIMYEHQSALLGMAVPPAFPLVVPGERKNSVWYQNLHSNMVISDNKIFLGNLKINALLACQQNRRMLQGSALTPKDTLVDMNLKTFSYKLKGDYAFSDKTQMTGGIQGMWQTNKNGTAPNHVMPDAGITDFSLFAMIRHKFSARIHAEAGVRYDFRHLMVPDQENNQGLERNFNNVSASAGVNFNLSEKTLLRFNIASGYRNPNLAELTQNGLHGVRYEIGDANLKNQQNIEADLGFHTHTRHVSAGVNLFYNKINGYIYPAKTGDTTGEGYPVYRYMQSPAHIYGGEAVLHVHPHPWDWLHLKATYSYLLGQKKSGEYLPMIPANRINGEVMVMKNRWKRFGESYLKLTYGYVFAQNKPSEFETASEPYGLLGFAVGSDIHINDKRIVSVAVSGSNLLNVNYMDHLSTLQDAGLYNPGRNITFSVKIPFGVWEE